MDWVLQYIDYVTKFFLNNNPEDMAVQDTTDYASTAQTDTANFDHPAVTVAQVEIIINAFLPNGNIFHDGDDTFVYVDTGRDYEKRSVELGTRNDNHVIVTAGLDGGERVCLRDPMRKNEGQWQRGSTSKSSGSTKGAGTSEGVVTRVIIGDYRLSEWKPVVPALCHALRGRDLDD